MAAKQGFTAQISQASEDAKRAVLSRAPNSIKSHSWLSNLNTTCTIKSAPPRTPEVMTMLGVKSGWLVKRNEQHVWQRRWCCVVPHTFLYYFEAEPIMEGDFDEDGNPIVPTTSGRSGGVVDNQDKLNAAVRFGFGRQNHDKRSSYYPSLHMYPSSGNNNISGSGPHSPNHNHSSNANDTSFESPAGTSSLIVGPPPPPVDTTRGPNAPAYSNLQPVGIIDLECYTNVNRSNVNDLVFEVTGDEITNPDLRSFYFMAGSAEECETWTKALLSDRHSSLRDEREAYRQVCDSFPIQLQQCSDLIDAAELKAEEAEKESYHIRSAAEEGRRRVAELVREVLDRDYWGPASNENAPSEASGAQQNTSWRSAQSPKGSRAGPSSSSPSSPNNAEQQRRPVDAKLDSNRKAYLAQFDEIVSSANTVTSMSGGVIPVVQLLTDYVTSIVASHIELRGEMGNLEQKLRRHDHSDRAAAADLRAQIERMEHERSSERHREDKRVQELQAQLDQAKRTAEDLENQLQSQRMDFTMYQNQTKGKVSELVQHKKILKKEVIDLRKKVDEIGSERDAAMHRIDNLSTKIETERERQRLLESYVEKVESQVRVQQNMMEMMSQGGGNSVVGRVVGGPNGGDAGSIHGGVGALSVHGDMSFGGGAGGGNSGRSAAYGSGMPSMDYRSQPPQTNVPSDSQAPPLPPRPSDSPVSHKPPASPSVSQLPKGFRTVEAPPTPTSAFPRNHVVAADLSVTYPDHEDHSHNPADDGEPTPAENGNGGKEHLPRRPSPAQGEMASLADVLSDHMESNAHDGDETRGVKQDRFPPPRDQQTQVSSSGGGGGGGDKTKPKDVPAVSLSPTAARTKKVPVTRTPALDLDVQRGDSGRSFVREANDSGLTRTFDNTKNGKDSITRQISVESKISLEVPRSPTPVEGTATIEGRNPDSATDRRHSSRTENAGGAPAVVEERRRPTLESRNESPHEVRMRRFQRALALKRGANASMGQPTTSRTDVVPPDDPVFAPPSEQVMRQDNDISFDSPSPHRNKESTTPTNAEQSFMSDDLDEMDSRSHISELTEDRTQREIEKVAKQHAWAAIRSRTDLSVEDNRLPPRGAPPSSLQGVNKSMDDAYGRREDPDRRLTVDTGEDFNETNGKGQSGNSGRGRGRGEKEGQYPPTYIIGGGRGGSGGGAGAGESGEAPLREDQWRDSTPMRSHLGTIDMKSPVQPPRPAGLPPQGTRGGDSFARQGGNNNGAPPASWSVGSDGKGPGRMGSFEDRSMNGSAGSFGSASGGGKKMSVAQRARMEADSPSVGSGTLLIRVPSSNSVDRYVEGQQQQQQQKQQQQTESSSSASVPPKPRPVSPTPSARSFFSGWGKSISDAMGGKNSDDELSKSGLGSITNTIGKGPASPEERRQRDQLVEEITTPLARRQQIQREKQMAFLREKGLIAEGKGGTETRSLASTTASMTSS